MNIRDNHTKRRLPLFFIDLNPSANNKDVYDIKRLQQAIVTVEPPRKSKTLVQCTRCQEFGHTKNYCCKPFRCVKCPGNHETAKCTKDITAPPTCSLCGENHPANYKGCRIYLEAINKRRSPQAPSRNPNLIEENQRKYRRTSTNSSYADITKNRTTSQPPQDQGNQELNQATSMIEKSFERLETLLTKQAEQLTLLINLLTKLVSKM